MLCLFAALRKSLVCPTKPGKAEQRNPRDWANSEGVHPEETSIENEFSYEERLGPTSWKQRMNFQVYHASDVFSQGRNLFHFENADSLHVLLYTLLKLTGLYGLGNRQFLDLKTEVVEWALPDLPPAFDGYRILQLSDLHLDLDTKLTPRIIESLSKLDYDICVLTGDFRAATSGPHDLVVEEMGKIYPHIKAPCFAILGNHDFIEEVAELEALGINFLLNENVELQLEEDEASIHLVGIDDSSFYETENFERAIGNIDDAAFKILLAHSPDVYRRAASLGFALQLSGHTHGGQICLPGGIPLLRICRCPAAMIAGRWEHQGMLGYTSRGTGSCGVPVRFFCPPEITLHTLRSKADD